MAFQVSPGIEVKEYDFSAYVPGVATTEAAIGGVFSWGPVEKFELVSSEEELALRFGRPTDDNYETFLIAANFLAYSDALYVSRAADGNTFNAQAYDDGMAPSPITIKNDDDFEIKESTIAPATTFVAKYPGSLGNSLKISVCASAEAYESTVEPEAGTTLDMELNPSSRIATVSVVDGGADGNVALSSLTGVLDEISVGDIIVVNNVDLRVSSIGSGSIDSSSNTASATITFQNHYTLPTIFNGASITRRWEYYNLVSRAPGTSTYVEGRGGSGDEMHIVISDRGGDISGQPNTILEVWESLSRATDSKNENGTANHFRDVINESSLFAWVGSNIGGITSDTAANMTPITVPVYTSNFTMGANGASESLIELGDLARAYDQFKSTETLPDLAIVIAGKAVGGSHGEALANYIIDNIAETRKDCVVTISPQMSDVVGAPFQEDQNLVEFRSALRATSRGFLTSSYKYQLDKYSNKFRWVAGCGDDAGLIARTDHERDPWWSPAGQARGQYKNIIKLAYNPDKSARDVLYRADINPVISRAGSGTHLFGDKTLLGKPSAFDRINVRRLFDTIEKAISRASRDLLFEFNNVQTRARFRNMVEPYLRDIMGRQGITRFKVVCDESNNTPAVIDRNEFVGSIMVVPAKSINYITLNFYAVANTLEFDYVIGQI